MIIGLIQLNLVSCFGGSQEERLPCSIGKLSRDQVLWSICQIICLIVFSSQCLFFSCVKGHHWMAGCIRLQPPLRTTTLSYSCRRNTSPPIKRATTAGHKSLYWRIRLHCDKPTISYSAEKTYTLLIESLKA